MLYFHFYIVLHLGSKYKVFLAVLIRSNFSRRTCCTLYVRAAIHFYVCIMSGPAEKNAQQHVYEIYSKSLRAQLLRVKASAAVACKGKRPLSELRCFISAVGMMARISCFFLVFSCLKIRTTDFLVFLYEKPRLYSSLFSCII